MIYEPKNFLSVIKKRGLEEPFQALLDLREVENPPIEKLIDTYNALFSKGFAPLFSSAFHTFQDLPSLGGLTFEANLLVTLPNLYINRLEPACVEFKKLPLTGWRISLSNLIAHSYTECDRMHWNISNSTFSYCKHKKSRLAFFILNEVEFNWDEFEDLDFINVSFFNTKFFMSHFENMTFELCNFTQTSFNDCVFKNCKFNHCSFKTINNFISCTGDSVQFTGCSCEDLLVGNGSELSHLRKCPTVGQDRIFR